MFVTMLHFILIYFILFQIGICLIFRIYLLILVCIKNRVELHVEIILFEDHKITYEAFIAEYECTL